MKYNANTKMKKYFTFKSIKQEDANIDERIISFRGTDNTKDRDGDVITHSGWEVDSFMKNPVFLWAHKYGELPIGKALNLTIDDEKGLDFDIQFASREEYAFADTVYKLYKGGYLSAVSIGFIPKGGNYDKDSDTYFITEKEMLELSAVPVPANPNALQNSLGKAMDDGIINEQEVHEFFVSSKEFIESLKTEEQDDDEKPVDPSIDNDDTPDSGDGDIDNSADPKSEKEGSENNEGTISGQELTCDKISKGECPYIKMELPKINIQAYEIDVNEKTKRGQTINKDDLNEVKNIYKDIFKSADNSEKPEIISSNDLKSLKEEFKTEGV